MRNDQSVVLAPFEIAPGSTSHVLLQRHQDGLLSRLDHPSNWLAYMSATGRSDNTVKAYGRDIAVFWRWCVDSGRDPMAVDGTDLTAFCTVFSATPVGQDLTSVIRLLPTGDGRRAASSVARALNTIKQFHQWARHQGLTSRTTATRVAAFRAPRVPQKASRTRLRPEDQQLLRDKQLAARGRLAVELLNCGLRKGEALGLRIEDLHTDKAQAELFGCRFPGSHVHVVKRHNVNGADAKSSYDRIVPVSIAVLLAWNDYLSDRWERLGAGDLCPYVFVKHHGPTAGSPWHVDSFDKWWRRWIQVDIPSATPHVLRHSFASDLIDAGVDRFLVQALLGHRRQESTAVYVHPDEAGMTSAVQLCADWRDDRMRNTHVT